MNIFKFFQKNNKESLQFFYLLIEAYNYLFSKYQKSKNPLITLASMKF